MAAAQGVNAANRLRAAGWDGLSPLRSFPGGAGYRATSRRRNRLREVFSLTSNHGQRISSNFISRGIKADVTVVGIAPHGRALRVISKNRPQHGFQTFSCRLGAVIERAHARIIAGDYS